ncbi:MAG: hypothetical protein KUG65_01130 [Sphingomonadaceae bacterium]|nr:hypothetical protein [Sphingomonadaceae bacterium]
MAAIALSLMVLTAIALTGGAFYLWLQRHARKQALLMALLAAVIAGNVAIWAVPDSRGGSLLSGVPGKAVP